MTIWTRVIASQSQCEFIYRCWTRWTFLVIIIFLSIVLYVYDWTVTLTTVSPYLKKGGSVGLPEFTLTSEQYPCYQEVFCLLVAYMAVVWRTECVLIEKTSERKILFLTGIIYTESKYYSSVLCSLKVRGTRASIFFTERQLLSFKTSFRRKGLCWPRKEPGTHNSWFPLLPDKCRGTHYT